MGRNSGGGGRGGVRARTNAAGGAGGISLSQSIGDTSFGAQSARLSRGNLSSDEIIVRPSGVGTDRAMSIPLPARNGEVRVTNDFNGTMTIRRTGQNSFSTSYERDGLSRSGGESRLNLSSLRRRVASHTGGAVYNRETDGNIIFRRN